MAAGLLPRLVASMGLPGSEAVTERMTAISRMWEPDVQLAAAVAQSAPRTSGLAPAPQRWPSTATAVTTPQAQIATARSASAASAADGQRRAVTRTEYNLGASAPPDTIADPQRAWSERVSAAQQASARRRRMASTGRRPLSISGAQRAIAPYAQPARLVGA